LSELNNRSLMSSEYSIAAEASRVRSDERKSMVKRDRASQRQQEERERELSR